MNALAVYLRLFCKKKALLRQGSLSFSRWRTPQGLNSKAFKNAKG